MSLSANTKHTTRISYKGLGSLILKL